MDVRYWSRTAGSFARHTRSPGFLRGIAAAGIDADHAAKVPNVPFFETFPALNEVQVDLATVAFRPGNLDPYEQYAIAAVAQLRQPKRIFELGTYDGATTLLLARNAPAAEVFTIDLPPDKAASATVQDEIANNQAGNVGARFRKQPEAARITQFLDDTRTFDFSPWRATIDLVVVDAGHEYPNVKADTATALSLLAPGGVVIWDDYTVVWPGVIAAVDETRLPVFLLGTSELAVYDSGRSLGEQ